MLLMAAFLMGCGSDPSDSLSGAESGDNTGGAEALPPTSGEPLPSGPAPGGGDIDPAAGGSTFNPVAGEWRLRHATIEGDMAIVIPEDSVPTMTIEGTNLDAFFGCNNGGGTVEYDIAGDAFAVSVLSMEQMGCEEELQTGIETAMSRVLSAATTYSAQPGSLTISDGAEFASTLEFEIVQNSDGPADESE